MDWSPPGFSTQGVSEARILEWVAISEPGDLPNPEIEPVSLLLSHQEPCIGEHENGKEVSLTYKVPGITFCMLYHIYTLIYHEVAV